MSVIDAIDQATAFARTVRVVQIIITRAGPGAGLLALFLYFGLTTEGFFTKDNLIYMALQIAVVALLAIGETFVIVAGGIDLSVGSVLALSGVTTALLLTREPPVPVALAIGAGLGVGALCGLINGTLVTQAQLPPFIVTLGMMGICRGLAKIWTDAQNIDLSGSPTFTRLGSERVLADWVPVPVLALIVVALVAVFILRFTALGRYCYAMGSNKEAARLSGVNVKLHTTVVFIICGLLAGLAGVVQAARVGIGQPTGGMGYELDGIAAAVIGGASLMGGVGTISGTILGALIMAVLRSGCDLKGVSPHLQDVVIGGVIVLAVLVDRIRQR
ncbi:MAG: ABC transporter permease [Armatimonadetes bacterium]|nr:ABC transporter permease [Armatimonadota bacterium]